MMSKVLGWIYEHQWAITESALETIVQIANRENSDMLDLLNGNKKLDTSALSSRIGQPLQGAQRVEVRNDVAIIPITGPIFPRANIMTQISGATSIQLLAQDFNAALSDKAIKAILFNIDSPGGEVTGVSEFAAMVYKARGVKSIVAYGYGNVASAAYWIASAADRIVISDTAKLGSIGVITAIQDNRIKDHQEGTKKIEIVSSISPNKSFDPGSNNSIAQVQSIIDNLAGVMVQSIATYRGTDPETVIQDFGKGGVLVGALAYGAGLADQIGSFEDILSQLSQTNSTKPKTGGVMNLMELQTDHAALFNEVKALGKQEAENGVQARIDTARNEGIEAEAARLQGIDALAVTGMDDLIAAAKADKSMTPEKVALQIVKKQKELFKNKASNVTTDAQALAAQTQSLGATQSADQDSGASKDNSKKEAAEAIAAGMK
jgi:ClpP class serine protease